MKDNAKNAKISVIISIFSIIISLMAVIISAINIRFSIVNGKTGGSDITLFCCTITVLCSNIIIFITSNNKYKKFLK